MKTVTDIQGQGLTDNSILDIAALALTCLGKLDDHVGVVASND